MKFRQQLFAAIIFVMAATAFNGCEQDNPATTSQENVVHNFEVIAINRNTDRLNWGPPSSLEKVAYRITWRPFDQITSMSDTGTIIVGDFQNRLDKYTIDVDNLQGKMYQFRIHVITSDYKTVDAYVENYGAPAKRYTTDAVRSGEQLQLYESGSVQGEALYMEPDSGGPTRLSLAQAHPGTLQFVLLPEGGVLPTDYFRIAAPWSETKYNTGNLCDQYVWFITNGNYDLNSWYVSYDQYFQLNSNQKTYSFMDVIKVVDIAVKNYSMLAVLGDRAGTNYRYVHLSCVPDANGLMLRGTAPNRYVVVEISLGYRGVPFA